MVILAATKMISEQLCFQIESMLPPVGVKVKRSRLISYAAIFTALYMLLSYSISISVGPVLRGSGAHLFRALLMAIIAAMLRGPGGPIMMSIISGVLLLAVPAPAAFLYLPGTLAAGLVYDFGLRGGNYSQNARNGFRILTASVLSGIAEAIVVTGGFFIIGFSFIEIVTAVSASGYGSSGLAGIWAVSIGKNIVMSTIGASLAILIIRLLPENR